MRDDRALTQRLAIYTKEDEALRQQVLRFCREQITLVMTKCAFDETRQYVAERQAYGTISRRQ